jgi:hypothetical protein
MLIAIEAFFVLVVVGLLAVVILQRLGPSRDRGHKGDAIKSPEEIESHRPRQ